MRHIYKFSLSVLGLLTLSGAVFAVKTHYGDIEGDLIFPNGVLLEGVKSTAPGKASVTLGGTGTLTVTNQGGPGGFPRLTVLGGVTITSTRSFASDEQNVTTWDGQFSAPASTIKPSSGEIVFTGGGQVPDVEVLGAFNWGLANETFSFSPAARVVLPVDAQDGQKVWIAYQQADGWKVQDSDFCIVQNKLCYLETGSVNKLALVKKLYETCPRINVENGSISSPPDCIITCDRGFELGSNAESCVAVNDENFDDTTGETDNVDDFALTQANEELVLPEKEYDFPPGHFRYRDSGGNMYRYFDESGLEGEDLEAARHANTSYLSRNPRTAEEQLKAKAERENAGRKKENEESFISYLIQMRNRFGDNAQENYFTALSNEEGENADETASVTSEKEESESFHASGPLLPSTGPGVFLAIAIVGGVLMLFGMRRT